MTISERPTTLKSNDNGDIIKSFDDICKDHPELIRQVENPGDLEYARVIFKARRKYQEGDKQALNSVSINKKTQERAQRLPSGLKIAIYKATAILDSEMPEIREEHYVVHGEIKPGEVGMYMDNNGWTY